MATGLTAAWQGMQSVTGDRTMPMLKKAFGSYNAYEDPKFYQDWQMFEQNPTAQRADMMLKEYGDTLDAEDQQALLSKITPMEGTPQYYDWKNAETKYNINQDKATQVGIETEGMKEYYMPTKALEFQMLGNQADMTATEAENFGEMQDLQMEAQQLSNNYQQLQNEWKRTTDPIKKQQLEYDLQLTEETLDDRIAQIQAQSKQAQTQADYSQRTLDDRVALAGEQALSAALGNEIQQAQKPALIEQPYLQNEGSRINNQGGRLNNQLTQLKLEQAQNPQEQNSIAYWSEQLGSNFGYAGSTQNGELVFEDTRGGRIAINPQTGETRDFTGQNVEGVREEVMVDPFEMLWNDPIARNTLGQDTITEMATSGQYPRQMTLDEARKFIDNLTYDFDISDILTSGSLAQNYRPEQSLNEYIQNGGQTQPPPEGTQPPPEESTTVNIQFGASAKQEADDLIKQAATAGLSTEELISTIENNFESMQKETNADLNQVLNILKNLGRF